MRFVGYTRHPAEKYRGVFGPVEFRPWYEAWMPFMLVRVCPEDREVFPDGGSVRKILVCVRLPKWRRLVSFEIRDSKLR